MTQIRPRIEDNLAPLIQAWADRHHVSFNAATNILISIGLEAQVNGWPQPTGQEIQR
jgi:hypothetical protein